MEKQKENKKKDLISYIIIILAVVTIRLFIITPVRVQGTSMDTTLKQGEILLLEKFDKNYKRFDIVVINTKNERIIKRIIGMPSESIKIIDGIIYINGEKIEDKYASSQTKDFSLEETIPENTYFVLGDNRIVSNDSRYLGPIKKENIQGKAIYRIWPFKKFGEI